MFVTHRFHLNQYTKDLINDMEPKFGYEGFGEFIFYRTYSRITREGKQENWADVVIRVIEGTFSIRKDWYLKTGISWDEKYWQELAKNMAISMFKMEWLPPGRGLWTMGTDFMYERGGMCLYNCAHTGIYFDWLDEDIGWSMDSLMLGVGVGFTPYREDNYKFKNPKGNYKFVISDSREGWVEGYRRLFRAYMHGEAKPEFIYDELRPQGSPIKGFGGYASGPKPLKELYEWTEQAIDKYMTDNYYDSVLLKTDIENQTGCCVISGNSRRSAELGSNKITDPVFLNIKDYSKYPERAAYGWMSNNASLLEEDSDFELLHLLADGNKNNRDIGFINLQNFPKGRLGKRDKVRKDRARGANPCGEICLEGDFDTDGISRVREVCNVDDIFPIRCESSEIILDRAIPYATIYASTVSLLQTHQPSTNRVVARNRRIGVGICGVNDWVSDVGMAKVIKYCRQGYKILRKTNRQVNGEAGVPESIRLSTVKPNGTTRFLAGATAGAGYNNFHYMIRRVRVGRNTPIHPILVAANVSYEEDLVSANTDVFEFPLRSNLNVAQSEDISVWQQAMNVVMLQREWSDNSVSNTLNFRPKWVLTKHFQEGDIEGKLKDELIDNGYAAYYYEIEKDLSNKDVYEDSHFKVTVKWDNNYNEMTEAKIYQFDPRHEEDALEAVLAAIAPVTKTVSMLPHTAKGVYPQMPEEGITEEEYHQRLSLIKKINWSKLKGSEGIDERYCSGESCERI